MAQQALQIRWVRELRRIAEALELCIEQASKLLAGGIERCCVQGIRCRAAGIDAVQGVDDGIPLAANVVAVLLEILRDAGQDIVK